MNKKQIRNFLNYHYEIESSAAHFQEVIIDEEEKLIMEFEAMGIKKPEDEEMENRILNASKAGELVNLMRKQMCYSNDVLLVGRLIENEREVMPIIKKKVITTLQDYFIERAMRFFTKCEENPCQWIVDNYRSIRNEYMREMLCMVLGYRGDPELIPFLIDEADRFEEHYPDESYDQGPFLAVERLVRRYRLL